MKYIMYLTGISGGINGLSSALNDNNVPIYQDLTLRVHVNARKIWLTLKYQPIKQITRSAPYQINLLPLNPLDQFPLFHRNHRVPIDTWTDSTRTNTPRAHPNSREHFELQRRHPRRTQKSNETCGMVQCYKTAKAEPEPQAAEEAEENETELAAEQGQAMQAEKRERFSWESRRGVGDWELQEWREQKEGL